MGKPTVLFTAVASELHLGRAEETSSKAFKALGRQDIELLGSPRPFTSAKELEEALRAQADLKVVFVASGGTSRILSRALGGLKVFLWAHPHDNSLPSALSAREKMRSSGSWVGEIAFSSPDQVPKEVLAEIKVLKALTALSNMKVLAFCSSEKAEELEGALAQVLGPWRPRLKRLEPDELVGAVEGKRRVRSISEALSIMPGLSCEEPTPEVEEGFVKSIELALYIEDELLSGSQGAVITFDCFDLLGRLGMTPCVIVGLLLEHGITAVCEADPGALILMAVCHLLTGQAPWMANLAGFDLASGTILLAHCTACPSLSSAWPYRGQFLEHFESGKPVALDVWLRRGPAVLANLQVWRRKLILARGFVEDSGMGEEGLCRTQALVRLDGDLRAFLAETGNHHVLTYSDIYDELARLGRRLGLEVVVP